VIVVWGQISFVVEVVVRWWGGGVVDVWENEKYFDRLAE